ncbi:hypothetical protein AS159_01555 [Thermotoga sp. Ku-13t]|nr:hypothetical protein AS159_01555 [Thermotoga sp. Ku-13t]
MNFAIFVKCEKSLLHVTQHISAVKEFFNRWKNFMITGSVALTLLNVQNCLCPSPFERDKMNGKDPR